MATAPWWNQEELVCLITRWATPTDIALARGTGNIIWLLSLASLNTLVQPLAASVCGVSGLAFTHLVCIYSIRSCLWLFAASVLQLLSWTGNIITLVSLASLNTLVQPLAASVCGVSGLAFTHLVCIYSISLLFLTVRGQCPPAALLNWQYKNTCVTCITKHTAAATCC